uniref:Dmx like 1 n=1 Tax=Oryzias latipes TaxID=8090 RepID=A0A3P9LQA5_ORYLA
MNLHQVLTGAVNPGDNCFSVGSINNMPFTAYASGCDVVILGSNFERLQIIPGAKHGNIQVGCVDCSLQGGQVRIEDALLFKGNCQWQKAGQFVLESMVRNLAWHPTGICRDTKCVFPPVSFLQDDCLVKVWYSTNKWKSGVPTLFTPPDASVSVQGDLAFSFVYLAHPRSVTGFSWRKTSKYMPRAAVCNVLLTCCKDNVCRLWAETMLPGDSFLYGHFNSPFNFQESWHSGSYRDIPVPSLTGCLPNHQSQHFTHKTSSNEMPHANALCHFHIAASINPATDIPLLPSISSLGAVNDEEPGGLFTVHWLNNKELHFTLSMEVFLQQLRSTLDEENEYTYDEEDNHSTALEHQVNVLSEEWNKGADMLFSIHPMDGSLLVWHVDWLDEYQPGMFRQTQVSFVSRIPVAFPTGDAISLSHSVVMYACNKNVDLAIQHGRQRPPGTLLSQTKSTLISYGCQVKAASNNSLRLSIFTPNVLMISKHDDGSLNQWAVSFAEDSAFSTVLSVSHKSRYCGHRFHLNELACHSLLPLLLTTSHHNALRTPEAESILTPAEGHRISVSHSTSLNCGSRPSRVSLGGVSQDPNAIYSELILWRVDPVGPLSLSGGVSELARINSLHASAFANVAWLPTLIPSSCLGVYCNSPSACFVASDGQSLRLYQAVIEAKKLLSELSNPEISRYVGEVFNIISQQSTAKPGCIIELDAITDFQGKETQLLHVFEENLILGSLRAEGPQETPDSICNIFSEPAFSARFFLVVVELTQTGRSLLHMWQLHLAALPVILEETPTPKDLTTPSPMYNSQFLFDIPSSPVIPRRKPSTTNLQTACRLSLTTRKLFSQELSLPPGVEAISFTPSAGHLSASCSLPAGRVPYLLASSCSDGKVRFWQCSVSAPEPTSTDDFVYQWEEWTLLVDERLPNCSAVSVPGRPINVSCSFPPTLCDSTGGSQWILEQTIFLDSTDPTAGSSAVKGVNLSSNIDLSMPNDNCPGSANRAMVHLDWVSQEDGSHILTVGIGTRIYMYGCLSGKPPELVLSSDAKRDHSLSRLVLLRSVSLVSSVDGSLPIPVSLSWVRDGILVVGMDCEMHVYSQWQPQFQEDGVTSAAPTPLLAPPKKALTRSMMSLAQKLSGKKTVYDLPVEMEDSGLFEAAHQLFPTLPQYHPVQLLELMDLGKVHRAKAILSHLVKCIAGEIVTLKESTTNQEKRIRSRTISVGGSTARDEKIFSKSESSSPDYTEISSVPPLPLYALLAADEDTPQLEKGGSVSGDSGHGSSQTDAYDELFHTPNTVDLNLLNEEQEETGSKVIDLSKYSPTYFGPEHAQVLSSHLLHSSLPGLTRMEQMSLMALADTIATTSTDLKDNQAKSKGGETLDECGLKFLLAVRLHTFLSTSLPPAHRAQLLCQGLSTCHYAWAFHSEAEEELLNMLPAMQKGEPTWPELRSMGLGWWLRSTDKLRRCIEKVAKASFQKSNDPLDAAIFYLALKKKAVVWGLYRSQKNAKMTEFFRNNFSEDRWRKAALKNAFSLLGKQRFQHSAAFFLLAGSLKDAVEVCLEKMQDLQLALVISRLYESEFETSSTYKKILQRHVLGQDKQIPTHPDPFLRSIAYWVLEDYSRALDTLIVQTQTCDRVCSPLCNPEVFNFYIYLRTHPLLLRRHFASCDRAKVGLTTEGRRADSISLDERRLFFTTAYTHLQTGCPMLALEVLSKMPKVHKRSKLPNQDDSSISAELSVGSKNGPASDPDWSRSALNGFDSAGNSLSNSQSDSLLSFDWSQPSLNLPDEPLELKWDSDKDDEDADEDEEPQMTKEEKDCKTTENSVFQDIPNAFPAGTESSRQSDLKDEDDCIVPSDDILVCQLKFTACLKIMANELRTLSTGYELEGGKLRYQLCQWLEREVLALQRCCSYKPRLPKANEACNVFQPHSPRADSHKSRRQWLQSNQPLLRMFLSYCSLHGSHGGGLASVRMELILLLQESHQSVKPLGSQHTSIPLLMACTASVKTVVANPIVYLTNLAHDILQTINALDSPPHPDIVNNEIYVMHTLAASLSACIYQCLCDGHTYSHVNHFTGTVYQSVLLSQKQLLRAVSTDESAQPNTSPAQWPGIASLIRLLNSAGEDSQPGLAVLLCEILTAVYLSLFIHGMATHSSNELFRIVTHPLHGKLWVSVFGGGARIPVMGKPSSPTRTPPPVTSVFKDQFVPPELSIWDYFIAKPVLSPLENKVEYDSEESLSSQEEDDDDDECDDVFEPSSPQKEHANNNSYSWCLMRLAMVQLVLVNLKSFYPMAGYDLLDLPVASPLCHAVLKTLQRWEQVLQKRLEIFGGPPPKYISTHLQDESITPGPALLRHKALFEPCNTPFRASHSSALPVKRLWQYLVKQEELQETFIRNIFSKKHGTNQTESDQNTGGGKARIIHKESDIITAFAINKANRNCLVMASTHDIQELDVSSILATQILTWIDDEEPEAKGYEGDDFLVVHARDDFAALHGTTPYTHSSPGTPINVPWLGAMQTGRGAAVMIKRNINNVRRMTSHPTLPYYLTGAQDGSVRMFEWGHSQQITCFRSPGNSRVTRIRFNHQGNKFGIVDADGALSLWQTSTSGNTPKPYLTLQCHNKTAHDFVFVGSSSLIATAGLSTDNRNVCLWDTLVTPANSLIHAFCCHDSGATVLSVAPKRQLLITGGRKGWISVLELPNRHQRQSFQAHDSPVKALAVDSVEDCFISGSAEGNIKVWSLASQSLLYSFPNEHARQSLFRNLGTGVMQIEVGPANHVFSCGADGTMKMRSLPNRFSVVTSSHSNAGNNVKFFI